MAEMNGDVIEQLEALDADLHVLEGNVGVHICCCRLRGQEIGYRLFMDFMGDF
jgi:hypothetical protein